MTEKVILDLRDKRVLGLKLLLLITETQVRRNKETLDKVEEAIDYDSVEGLNPDQLTEAYRLLYCSEDFNLAGKLEFKVGQSRLLERAGVVQLLRDNFQAVRNYYHNSCEVRGRA